MFKAMIMLKRNENLEFDAFKQHWLENHAALVRQLPGIRKAVFNFSSDQGMGEIDAISELWFNSEQDFIDAYASDIGKQVTEDSLSMVSKRERIFINEHQIV